MKRLRKLQESLPTEDFTPRDYQLDLLENALHENTVAALGSDGGKSFLALSLLRELAQDMRRDARTTGGKRRTAIITVETDLAADDYVRAVEDHTDFTAVSLKDNNAADVIGHFEVIISSHENFFAAMKNGMICADDISVIVIDECTSAVARHPYQKLFEENFAGFRNGGVESRSKPRILALTSALLTKDVVGDPAVLEGVIGGLERAFRSNLRTSVSLVSVDRFGYTKDVRLMPYSLAVPLHLQAGTNYVKTKLKALLDFVELCEQAGAAPNVAECLKKSNAFNIFRVALTESLECLRTLGLWPTYRLINIICRDFRQTHLKNLLEQRVSRLLLAVLCRFQEVGIALEKLYGFAAMEKGDERILQFISMKLRIIVDLMEPYNPHNPEEGKPYIPVQYLSMIVNVGRPYLAWAINRFIRDLKAPDRKCKYNYVTSSYCLGSFNSSSTNPADACYFGMPFKVQEEILRRFRNRDFNILISTCTNDVTLDVPQCTFAIQFDPVQDYLTYIHAKHRTKSKYGTLCILIPEEKQSEYIEDVFKKFQRIDSMVLSHCPDYITRSFANSELPEVPTSALKAATTGVQITMSQAVGVINRYCSNLPSDAFANLTPLADIQEKSSNPPSFVCLLTLPINAPLKQAVMGLPMPTKRLAKQSAALEMCRKLYDLGELDESLAPVSKDTWKAELARYVALEPQETVPDGGPKPGTTKRRQYYGKKVPKLLTDALPVADSRCYLYAIDLRLTCPVPQEQNIKGRKIHRPEESARTLGMLSCHSIPVVPDFNIYDRSGEVRVSIKLKSDDICVGSKELEMAQYFHYVMFSNVLALERFSLRYNLQDAPSKFLVVPIIKDGSQYSVDWAYMESVFAVKPFYLGPVAEDNREPYGLEKFSDAVVMPWYRSVDQPQSFYVEQICPWLTVESEFPDDVFKTFYDYYLAKYKISVRFKDQPLLDVDHTSTRLNLLLPRFLSRKGSSLTQTEKREMLKDNKEPRHRQILVPELCKVNPVSASLWRQGICLPTILHRMEALLVMEELMSTIKTATGIGSRYPEPAIVQWPMLDYGWSFEEKIKNLEGSHLERDAIDIKNATLIERARLRHEEERRRSAVPSIGMWNPADADALSECGSMTSGFEIGTWSMEPLSKDKLEMMIDNWRPDDNLEDEPAVPFFEHMQNTYAAQKSMGMGGGVMAHKAIQPASQESDEGFRPELEWGYNVENGGPGINLVSGFSDSVMQAIEKDLTNLNLDDTGMMKTASEFGDNETIADSTVSTLPVYNIEALDPLKDREEEDIGPVISSILHLRFSESAPDDLRGRLSSTQTPLNDVFEDMSEFSLDAPADNRRKKDEKKKDVRTEFGEVVRSSSVEKETTPAFSRPLVLVEPTVKFDDDRDPTMVPGPDPGIILQAFTSSNANDGINLERLETVGDSFLKFSMTTYLYFRYNGYHEGKLSFMRSLQVSNYNLYRLGYKKQFGEILLSSKFEPTENWLPPCYVLDEKADATNSALIPNLRTQHCISDKTLADCVESLIGAYLISSGIKAAQLLMSWLGLNVLPERIGGDSASCMVDRFTWFPKPGTVLLDSKPETMKELDRLLDGYSKFEDKIGYKFNDRAYLLQAFTHASYTYNRITDCYQRLEFLGDAVLDYLITRHLYEDLRGHTPGALTDLRSALVNNAIFASLSVRYEFHKYVKLMSPAIFHLVEKYVKEQRERDQNMTLFTEDIFFYDPAVDEDLLEDEGGAEETECPKVLGDVFESVAGAIYLDSGMSLDAVWKVYYSMMKSEIEQCSINIPKSPVRELLELEPENVKFSVPERTASGKIRVVVEIFDKGKFVGLGRNYRTAKCTAAKQALKYLRSLDDNNWK